MMTREGLPARTDWTLDPTVTHLNHGSYGAVPRFVQRAQARLYAEMESNPLQWFAAAGERLAAARGVAAQFVGSRAEDTVFVPNSSAGASTVFASLLLDPGDEILVTNHTYGAVRMGAERLARRWGAVVRTAMIELDADAEQALAAVVAEMGERTALVIVDQISSGTARRFPVAEIAREGRARGIRVMVDAAHAPGMVEAPAADVDADYWFGNLHKWACGPHGTAVLAVSPERAQEVFPLVDSWGGSLPFPERFDHRASSDLTGFLAVPDALGEMEARYGWADVHRSIRELADHAQVRVTAAMTEATGEDASVTVGMPAEGLRLVRLPRGLVSTPEDCGPLRQWIADELKVETQITQWRGEGMVRLSAHLYNAPEDYEVFVERVIPALLARARA